jgi:outer membrane protein OmpA-like peptidoglycan-associated protein
MLDRICGLLIGIAAMGIAAVLTIGPTRAEDPSASDIANSLAPKAPKTSLTRGLTLSDPNAASGPNAARDQQFIRGIVVEQRPITVEERSQIADIAKNKPGIDLEVNFDYNSATIGPQAIDTLTKLGVALHDQRLKGALVLLAGHTDAKGSDAYNFDLSNRRAAAVKQFLIERFNLAPENLCPVGFGKEHLKNTADPFAAENRRVQVKNMSSQ